MSPMLAVEGYFIRTVDNLVFEVKGILHPADRYVAYLRYIPRSGAEESGFNKICNLQTRDTFLRKHHPEYLWFCSVLGREVQSVPHDRVESVLDPVECLGLLRRGNERIGSLEEVTMSLASALVKNTRIGWRDIGVTGSQLVGTAGERSDIDLVVYGEGPCRRFYQDIAECFSVIPNMERYCGKELEEHLRFRWGELGEHWEVLRDLERGKLLQGLYKGFEFFVKLVKLPRDLEYSYGDKVFEHIGNLVLDTMVLSDEDSMFTPCLYDVDPGSSGVRTIVSYRSRFAEHVQRGDRISVSGRLEKVTDTRTGTSYGQVVLGEKSSDYLLPL